MTFCSKRMRENPGEVFDIIYRDGSTGKAFCNPAKDSGNGSIISVSDTTKFVHAHNWCGHFHINEKTSDLDIVAYAPRTEERWKREFTDGSIGTQDYDSEAMAESGGHKAVRVRITVIDEEAA